MKVHSLHVKAFFCAQGFGSYLENTSVKQFQANEQSQPLKLREMQVIVFVMS